MTRTARCLSAAVTLALAAGLTACDGETTAANDAGTSGDTSVSADGGTSADGGGTADGGAQQLGGLVTITHEGDELRLRGYFTAAPVPAGPFATLVLTGAAGLADGECRRFTDEIIEVTASLQTLDAGDSLSLSSGAATLSAPAEQVSNWTVYLGEGSGALFEGGASYTLDVAGGAQVQALSASIEAPPELTISVPNLDGTLQLDTSQDLPLSWSSAGQGSIYAWVLHGKEAINPTIFRWVCRFDDDGSGTIPASALAEFTADPTDGFFLLTVLRATVTPIEPVGAVAPVPVVFIEQEEAVFTVE